MYATAKIESKFTGLMQHAHEHEQTGKLYAYYRDDNVIHVGTLFFKKGRLCGCNYDKSTGTEALNSLASSVIATAMFVPSAPADLLDQPSIPDFDRVLKALCNGEAVGGTEHLSAVELIQAICATLHDILGEKMANNIKDLAQKTRASDNIAGFKEECMKSVSNFMGGRRAREILDPLFEMTL